MLINQEVATDAFVGDLALFVGDGGSPEAFLTYCEVTSVGALGEKNDIVEVTTLCNGGSKQYVGGLAEGQEFDFTANFAVGNPIQASLIQSVKDKENRNFEVRAGKDSPQAEFSFNAALISWGFEGSTSKANSIKFSAKISGPVTVGNA